MAPAPAPQPVLTEKGQRTATILGPKGEVLKVVEPVRTPFGFQPSKESS